VVMMATTLFAQRQDHSKNREGHAEGMKTVLMLSDDQYASIKGIRQKYRGKYKETVIDTSTAHKRAAIKTLQEERQREVEAVLTPEQKTRWTVFKAERAEKRAERRKSTVDKRQRQLTRELDLSAGQAEKMKQANATFREKTESLRQSSNVSADNAEMKKIRSEYKAAVKAILTEQQFERWQQRRKGRKAIPQEKAVDFGGSRFVNLR
jgi:flagellar hook-associated protein FlgK